MTGASDAVAAAVAAFNQAWADRSEAERDAFAQRLAPSGRTASGTLAPSAEAVLARAALSGPVDPRDLVHDFDEDEAARLLDRLAPRFDKVYLDERWAWTLRSESRREAISGLAAAGGLAGALDEASTVPTDEPGRLLRRIAAGVQIPPGVPAVSAVQALAWAAPLGGLSGELAEARRRASVQQIADGYGGLLRHGFFGRDDVLTRLRTFTEAPVDPARPVPLLVVTGIGGAGKSTTLAAFLQPYLARQAGADPAAPAIIVIDFDRQRFRIDAELELSFEVTRQLGAAHPVAGADFAALRYQARQERRDTGADVWNTVHTRDSGSRDASGFENDAQLLVDMHGLGARPVLLVLDTFEEWQRDRPFPGIPRAQPWNDPESRILAWIDRLRHLLGLRGLRVVVSGRAELSAGERIEVRAVEHLGDLALHDAQALLRAHHIGPAHARSLAEMVGGNPLTLRVAARYVGHLSAAERDAFLAGGPEITPALDDELRRAVLYDRFLAHIGDERVRALAHPGLVLRRVTPALVQRVLAPRCGLDGIDDETARELFERLADEVWLVTRDGDSLHHRADVRRAMLRMMVDDPKLAGAARAIHDAAVAWYEEGPNDLPPEAARVEALYHRLMTLPPDAEIPAMDTPLAIALGDSVGDLPRPIAAQVRAGRGDDLQDADAALLPDRVWRDWVDEQGEALVDGDEASRAIELLTTRPPGRRGEPTWLAQAYCDAARWPDYWFSDHRTGSGKQSHLQMSYTVVNAVCSGDPGQLDEVSHHLSTYLARHSPIGPPFYLTLLLRIAVEGPSGLPSWRRTYLDSMRFEKLSRREATFPVDQLRDAAAWASAGLDGPDFEFVDVTGLARLERRWIRDFGQLIDQPLRGNLPAESRAGEVLGRWTAQLRRLHKGPVTIDRGALVREPDLLWLLRGDNPEMRRGIRSCLGDVLRGGGLRRLGAIATDLLPVPATDLRPEELPPDDYGRRDLVTLVEYVDRSGVMGPFLDATAAAWPDSAPVRRVRDAFEAWDQANNDLLRAVGDQLRSGG